MLGQVGDMSPHLGVMLSHLGTMLDHFGPMLGHLAAIWGETTMADIVCKTPDQADFGEFDFWVLAYHIMCDTG